jgi:hypothetical protein
MLIEATKCLSAALDNVEAATELSSTRKYTTGIAFISANRSDLTLTQGYILHMNMLIGRAMRISPDVRAPPAITTLQNAYWLEHDARDELMRAEWHMNNEVICAKKRVELRKIKQDSAKAAMSLAKKNLQAVREKIYEEVMQNAATNPFL